MLAQMLIKINTNQHLEQTSDIQDLKKYDNPFRANGNYAKPPHNLAY
jgi:hypothetical protein